VAILTWPRAQRSKFLHIGADAGRAGCGSPRILIKVAGAGRGPSRARRASTLNATAPPHRLHLPLMAPLGAISAAICRRRLIEPRNFGHFPDNT